MRFVDTEVERRQVVRFWNTPLSVNGWNDDLWKRFRWLGRGILQEQEWIELLAVLTRLRHQTLVWHKGLQFRFIQDILRLPVENTPKEASDGG